MARSKQTTPHFYVTSEIRMDAAMSLLAEASVTTSLTVTHLVLKAIAVAVREHPRLNSSYVDEGVVLHPQVDLGLAISLEDSLVSPAIVDVGDLPLAELAGRATDLVARARQGRLTVRELAGGTITLSNLGMYGVDEFSAILNPPQAAILAMGAIVERPIVADGRLAVGRTMKITCSADHRVLDGVEVARFMASVKRLLEQPASMLS
jgi:pyruvate dehydrogenase E2 component (dihydrolipoamide acetyltransferase)